jgi:hypothetical protein
MDAFTWRPVGRAWGTAREGRQTRKRTNLIYTSDHDDRFNAGAAVRGQGPAV